MSRVLVRLLITSLIGSKNRIFQQSASKLAGRRRARGGSRRHVGTPGVTHGSLMTNACRPPIVLPQDTHPLTPPSPGVDCLDRTVARWRSGEGPRLVERFAAFQRLNGQDGV
jgi:hypothetical protein